MRVSTYPKKPLDVTFVAHSEHTTYPKRAGVVLEKGCESLNMTKEHSKESSIEGLASFDVKSTQNAGVSAKKV